VPSATHCPLLYKGNETTDEDDLSLITPPPSVKLGEKERRSLKSRKKWVL